MRYVLHFLDIFISIVLIQCVIILFGPLRPAYSETLYTATDSSGKVLQFTKPFTRIISLYPAHTENLCSLGAADQLIGIGRSDDFPQYILQKQRFSYREDPEKFIAARPDLVLIRPMIERSHPRFVEKLRRAGISVFSIQPSDINHLFEYWKTLGVLSGKVPETEEMIENFKNRLAQIERKVSALSEEERVRVYFESIHRRMKTFAPNSIGMYTLLQAGGVNVATDSVQVRKTNIADYGKEKLLAHGSSIDVFLAQKGRMNPISVETIMSEPGFMAIRAVREKRVYLVDEHLVSRPTMRLAKGIEKIHNLLYREGK